MAKDHQTPETSNIKVAMGLQGFTFKFCVQKTAAVLSGCTPFTTFDLILTLMGTVLFDFGKL